MIYTTYQLACLFFIYSFLGWCLEVVYAAVGRREFVNRGFLNGMLCPVYGVSMVFMLVFMDSLREEWFYLFLGCMVVGTVTELLTGLLLEKAFHLRLWDYSHRRQAKGPCLHGHLADAGRGKSPVVSSGGLGFGKKFQAGGYICFSAAMVWGGLGILVIKLINPLLLAVLERIPYLPGLVGLVLLSLVLAVDAAMTVGALLKIKNQNQAIAGIAEGLNQASRSLQAAIVRVVGRRMNRAFPGLKKKEAETEEEKQELIRQKTVFAYGCSFHKIAWIFVLGAFLGAVVEMVFCRFTMGWWMSRSSLVYGTFSLVWGIGVAGATIVLYRYRNQEDSHIFVAGTLLGGAYEYICSVFTELAFGTVFWDYSDIPFNLGGRINLLYCFFWGIAAWVWMKRLYPLVSGWIEKIPKRAGTALTYIALLFLACDIIISAVALGRYGERAQGVPPQNAVEKWMDGKFPDSRMDQIYPSAKTMDEWRPE